MADPTLVLLIVLGVSSADRPHGSTISAAVIDALGRDARVLVEERGDDPSDAEAAAVADGLRGSAVAEVSWGDETHARAHLHVYLAADRTWYDRDVAFEPGDALDERERAMGFLIGAMIRETGGMRLALPVRAPSVVPQPAPPVPPSAAEVLSPPVVRTEPRRFALDVRAVATTGIAGDAGALGPSLHAGVVVAESLSIDVGGSLGFGTIDAADARMATARLVAGGRWRWLTIGRALSFDLGVAALAVHHAVRRADPATDRDRWLSGGHVDVGAGWHASELVEPFVIGGIDAVAGNTPVNVGGARFAHIPPFRAVLELGIRMRF